MMLGICDLGMHASRVSAALWGFVSAALPFLAFERALCFAVHRRVCLECRRVCMQAVVVIGARGIEPTVVIYFVR